MAARRREPETIKRYHGACVLCPVAAVLAALTALTAAAPPEPRAFPGGEGFGAPATGGRGGRVYEVTSVDDDGRGSLRAAIEARGPRIVVFRVSGTIELESPLQIRNPDITIAGQTAPGDGICLRGYGTVVATDNVIIRYLRFRPGDEREGEHDALGGRGCRNVIIDHCSASWSIDECVSFYRNENVTVQWCLISESLYESHHGKGQHGYGGIWGGNRATYHHNLLAHHSSRNPRFASEDENVDYRNNVVYNWGFNSAYGGEGATVNMVANYYKAGPATRDDKRNRIVEPYGPEGRWYIAGNHVVGFPAITADNWGGGVQGDVPLETIKADRPFPAAPVKAHTAEEAYRLVLADVGAVLPRRDPLDARIVEEARTGTATYGGAWGEGRGIVDSQAQVGGWPELASSAPPRDSDHDGMPDEWERRHGLDAFDASDNDGDADSDGYTEVEEYLNDTHPRVADDP